MSEVTLPTNGNFRNLKGMKFGRLTVVEYAGNACGNRSLWVCLCECGDTTKVIASSLNSGHTKSCGCYHLDAITHHGCDGIPEHAIWKQMLVRCENISNERYADYGGRGIVVCDRWRESYRLFINDMGQRPSVDHSIDRINNDGNYSPENCRWATRKDQARNTRRNKMVTYIGETLCLAEWAENHDIKYQVLWARLSRGWTFERAITTPVRKRGVK